VLLLSGCEREKSLAVVSLFPKGLDPATRWLFVHTTFGDKSSFLSNRFNGAPDEVDLQFLSTSHGVAVFALESRDSFGAVLARGSASTALAGVGHYKLDVPLIALPEPTVLFRDAFDDGDLQTNSAPGGIGSGYLLTQLDITNNPGKQFSEADGVARISGSSTVKQLASQESFDPTGTTLTMMLKSWQRERGGVGLGWILPSGFICCDTGVDLVMESNRMYFEVMPERYYPGDDKYFELLKGMADDNATWEGWAEVDTILSISLEQDRWRVDMLGDGLEVRKQGTYFPGATLADVLKIAGGKLHPGVSIGQENGVGAIDSLLVTRP
jgi:hypothetical protein